MSDNQDFSITYSPSIHNITNTTVLHVASIFAIDNQCNFKRSNVHHTDVRKSLNFVCSDHKSFSLYRKSFKILTNTKPMKISQSFNDEQYFTATYKHSKN